PSIEHAGAGSTEPNPDVRRTRRLEETVGRAVVRDSCGGFPIMIRAVTMKTMLAGLLALTGAATMRASLAAIPASERAALIEIYQSTGGGGWTDNSGWCSGTCPASGTPTYAAPGSECGWHGVSCDAASAHVVAIDLSENHLIGSLPDL